VKERIVKGIWLVAGSALAIMLPEWIQVAGKNKIYWGNIFLCLGILVGFGIVMSLVNWGVIRYEDRKAREREEARS